MKYGYGQDEDQGQLGAWYVISSLGLFDLKGLTGEVPSFGLGAPLFDRITIRLNGDYYPGREFVITTTGNDGRHPYVEQYTLNGKVLHGVRLPFSEVAAGASSKSDWGANRKIIIEKIWRNTGCRRPDMQRSMQSRFYPSNNPV